MQWSRSGLVSWPGLFHLTVQLCGPALLAKVRTVAMTGLPTRIVLCMEQDTKAEEQLQSVQAVQLLWSISRGQLPLVDPGASRRGPLRRRNLRARQLSRSISLRTRLRERLADEIDQWCS